MPSPYSEEILLKISFAASHSRLEYLEYASEYSFVECFFISKRGSLSIRSSKRVVGSRKPFNITRSIKRQENLLSELIYSSANLKKRPEIKTLASYRRETP